MASVRARGVRVRWCGWRCGYVGGARVRGGGEGVTAAEVGLAGRSGYWPGRAGRQVSWYTSCGAFSSVTSLRSGVNPQPNIAYQSNGVGDTFKLAVCSCIKFDSQN
jgi:hypothetical protein